MRRLAGLLALVALVAACAYYNGLYNANRLAHEATRAEHEGRIGEARSLWSQAAVKAESVASRHPHSKYRDDAWLLQGRALQQMGTCVNALKPLQLAVDSSPDRELRTQAALRSGECRLEMIQPDSAITAVAPVLREGTAKERSEAQLLRGRAFLRLGRPRDALEELSASAAPGAAFPKAIVLAQLGRGHEGAAVLRALVAQRYVESDWLPVLDSLGRAVPDEASGLVDTLTASGHVGLGQRLRLWLADGERWLAAGDTARAEGRFAQVIAAGSDSTAGRSARAHEGVLADVRATSWSEIPALYDSLHAAIRQGGPPVRIGGRHANVLTRARTAVGSEGTALEWFLAAEDVRDSIGNPVLAASIFGEAARRFPTSVFTPKALLALAVLSPAVKDSVLEVLRVEYPTSPYTLMLRGEGSEAYEVLEDSLRRATQPRGRTSGKNARRGRTDL